MTTSTTQNSEETSMSSSSSNSEASSIPVTLVAKWGKERITLENLEPITTLIEVKEILSQRTRILPKRQKLIGLSLANKKGMEDDALVKDLKVKGKGKGGGGLVNNEIRHEFILMGTPEDEIFVDPSEREDLPDVIDDFDLDFNAGSHEWVQHVANEGNLRKFTESTAIHIMNQPRPNKPLLVLDLDHTLLDFSSKQIQRTTLGDDSSTSIMKRPYMDEFLTAAYKHYNLVVWSQTSWRWLETKLTELGMLTHPGYRFCFVMDKTSMFAVTSTKRDGTTYRHHVKPMQIIWTKFPQWGSHNTVHVDDLSRNFALNLTSGLKVTPYHRKKSKARRDHELMGLAKYLEELASKVEDFNDVNFGDWLEVVQGKKDLCCDESEGKKSDG